MVIVHAVPKTVNRLKFKKLTFRISLKLIATTNARFRAWVLF